jgi:DNA ligase-1
MNLESEPNWNGKELLSSKTFDIDIHDVSGWIASEKLDGIRAYWDGKLNIWSRQKKVIHAPEWFLHALPEGIPLDGELFGGRGNFQHLVSVVRKNQPIDDEWKTVWFSVFDAPMVRKIYERRVEFIREFESDIIKPCETWIIKSNKELLGQLETISDKGAEGLMVRQPGSFYEWKRSKTLIKVKKRYDSEATVIGYTEGTGKYTGMLGALIVKSIENINLGIKAGIEFKVGSGFTDVMRNKELYPIGTKIMFKYGEMTKTGKPRFPIFDKVYETI